MTRLLGKQGGNCVVKKGFSSNISDRNPFHLCGIGVYNAYFATIKGLQKTNSKKCVRILDVRVWTLSTTNRDLQ